MKDSLHADNRMQHCAKRFAQQAQRCGSELDSLESFSCSWATRFRTG